MLSKKPVDRRKSQIKTAKTKILNTIKIFPKVKFSES